MCATIQAEAIATRVLDSTPVPVSFGHSDNSSFARRSCASQAASGVMLELMVNKPAPMQTGADKHTAHHRSQAPAGDDEMADDDASEQCFTDSPAKTIQSTAEPGSIQITATAVTVDGAAQTDTGVAADNSADAQYVSAGKAQSTTALPSNTDSSMESAAAAAGVGTANRSKKASDSKKRSSNSSKPGAVNGNNGSSKASAAQQVPASAVKTGTKVADGITAAAAAIAAAKLGLIDQLTTALNNPAVSVNVQDAEGRACLHYTAGYGHEDCVELLLNKSADPKLKDKNGDVPLHFAAVHGQPMCAYTIAKVSGCSSLRFDHMSEVYL